MSIRAIKWAHSVMPVVDLPPTERLTLFCLAYHHNDRTGDCFPSMETLGGECGVTSRRIQQAIARLAAWGLISKRRGGTAAGNASNRYTLFGKAKRPKLTGKGVPVSRQFKPEQKSRFETGNRVPVSNRKPVSDDRGSNTGEEKTPAKLAIISGGRA
jgi:hypothetical protein